MEPLIQKTARLEFTRRAEISAELRLRLAMEFGMRTRIEQDKAEKEKQLRERAEFAAAMEMSMAFSKRVADFSVKLDLYETAAVDALLINERDLKAVREKIADAMLKAHILPDGRRVFKTEDGQRVFDEFGIELDAETISPLQIDDKKPRWETVLADRARETALERSRSDIHTYLDKVDHARERKADPGFSPEELDILEKDLEAAKPAAVRKALGERLGDDLQAGPSSATHAALDVKPLPGNAPSAPQF
jgi:hypothetical protein